MGQEFIDGFKFQVDIDGSKKLIIESSKLTECVRYVLDGKAKSITINCFQGYDLNDINFLNEISDVLESLHLPETKFDNRIVNTLHKLNTLGIADNGRDVIDLTNFPLLRNLACEFGPRMIGFEFCLNLESLILTNFKSKSNDLNELNFFPKLQELALYKTGVSALDGIERFKSLSSLELYGASKLKSIAALHGLSNSLKFLHIDKCKKIEDLESLGQVKALTKIIISESGEFENLSFVQNLKNLEFISFWGTNVKDGNLSYCEGIDYVGFDSRKHYSHVPASFVR